MTAQNRNILDKTSFKIKTISQFNSKSWIIRIRWHTNLALHCCSAMESLREASGASPRSPGWAPDYRSGNADRHNSCRNARARSSLGCLLLLNLHRNWQVTNNLASNITNTNLDDKWGPNGAISVDNFTEVCREGSEGELSISLGRFSDSYDFRVGKCDRKMALFSF